MKGLKSLISNDGVGAIEFHNAKKILLDNHYDYIYHEHIFYFTLSSLNNILKKNGLFGFDYFKSPISGGSYVIIFKTKKTTPTQKFLNIIKNEKKQKLDTVKFWQTLRKKCEEHKKKFLQKISNFNKLNIISAYGASARSSTLLNYLQLDHKFITQIFDINLLKKNMYSPGSHIRIKNPTMQNIKSTNIIILLAWNFKEEILKFLKQKNFKGKVFQPLPRIKIFKLR